MGRGQLGVSSDAGWSGSSVNGIGSNWGLGNGGGGKGQYFSQDEKDVFVSNAPVPQGSSISSSTSSSASSSSGGGPTVSFSPTNILRDRSFGSSSSGGSPSVSSYSRSRRGRALGVKVAKQKTPPAELRRLNSRVYDTTALLGTLSPPSKAAGGAPSTEMY